MLEVSGAAWPAGFAFQDVETVGVGVAQGVQIGRGGDDDVERVER
jgi:hypothetical protein